MMSDDQQRRRFGANALRKHASTQHESKNKPCFLPPTRFHESEKQASSREMSFASSRRAFAWENKRRAYLERTRPLGSDGSDAGANLSPVTHAPFGDFGATAGATGFAPGPEALASSSAAANHASAPSSSSALAPGGPELWVFFNRDVAFPFSPYLPDAFKHQLPSPPPPPLNLRPTARRPSTR